MSKNQEADQEKRTSLNGVVLPGLQILPEFARSGEESSLEMSHMNRQTTNGTGRGTVLPQNAPPPPPPSQSAPASTGRPQTGTVIPTNPPPPPPAKPK